MTISTIGHTVEQLGDAMFMALKEMDKSCPTGLCDFVSCGPFAGQKRRDEAAIVWGISERLTRIVDVDQSEQRFSSNHLTRCDRVFRLSNKKAVWVEFKISWRRWFYGHVKGNSRFYYESYFFGPKHGPDPKRSHSVAQDFEKLEINSPADASHNALLIVGFDGPDGQMDRDMDRLAELEKLSDRGWLMRKAEPWCSSQSRDCWNRAWFWWRNVAVRNINDAA